MPDLYRSLAEALVGLHPESVSPADDERLQYAAAFTRGQIAALPDLLRLQMRIGITFFAAVVRLRYLRPFSSLPLPVRKRIVTWWAFGPFAVTRKLFRPVRATALLAYYDHPATGVEGTCR